MYIYIRIISFIKRSIHMYIKYELPSCNFARSYLFQIVPSVLKYYKKEKKLYFASLEFFTLKYCNFCNSTCNYFFFFFFFYLNVSTFFHYLLCDFQINLLISMFIINTIVSYYFVYNIFTFILSLNQFG